MASATTKYIRNEDPNRIKQGFALTSLEYLLNSGQDLLARSQWNPLQNFAKSTILNLLQRITQGEITFESLGQSYLFGHPFDLKADGYSSPLRAKVIVKDERFWIRMLLHADFGFADSFMTGQIEVDRLKDVFKIFILNRKSIGELGTILSPIVGTISYICNLRLANGLTASKSNISAHYDLSNDVFAAYLSWDMTYSCALFDSESGGPTGDLIQERPIAPPRHGYLGGRTIPPDDLERGQLAKLHLVAQRAKIGRGSRVLEIGSGWGSFAILAAGTYGASVEALTLSEQQKIVIDQDVAEAGLSHAITTHVLDYRQLPESFHHAFDAVVSIGVMEHVGIEFMRSWFEKMSWAMRPENSFKVFTTTTVPDTRWRQYSTEVDFVRKYIYPGGQLSSIVTLVADIAAAGLNVESMENIGPHYARTLREWGYRFERNFDSHIQPALLKQYPKMTIEDVSNFKRKWIYYFAYCEAGFAVRVLSESVITLTREGNLETSSTCDDRLPSHFIKPV